MAIQVQVQNKFQIIVPVRVDRAVRGAPVLDAPDVDDRGWVNNRAAGLNVAEVNDAVKAADVIMILLPDENIAQVYAENVAPFAKQGATLAFAHGFNVHFGEIKPPASVDVSMIAPKSPGHLVRSEYQAGRGVPALVSTRSARAPRSLQERLVEQLAGVEGQSDARVVTASGAGADAE